MKFYIYTLGCKVNAYESEMMSEKLLSHGYIFSKENPDIIIVNTCSVTNVADKKSEKLVRQFKRNHKDAILVVCGCSSFHKPEDYQKIGIDILIGNTEKSQIVSLIENFLETRSPYVKFYKERNLPFEDMSVNRFTTHTRAFVKIQDGCDNFCSYCVIPFVRGSIRSKDFVETLNEVNTLVSNGHQEIVLTGIHTGSYGVNTPYDLTDLIHAISKNENLKRIRISSIEITELNDKFLKELKENPKICDHLHIPLQAGSNEILRKMNRKYDLKYFEEKLKKIREIRPSISITTDIIVGHPFETEELFLETIETSKRFQFSKIHVFPYSKREGTAASLMKEQVPGELKKDRSKRLCNLSLELEENYASKFLLEPIEVLVESLGVGCTSNYLKIKLSESISPNTFVTVLPLQYENGILYGEVLKDK